MKYGSIAAGSKEAVDSAKIILKKGGNAFDAAVGAVFTSMISEFSLTGAGGGGVLLGMEKGQSPIIYDFFVDCPKLSNKKVDFEKISVNFGDTIQNFQVGRGSAAIPGNIAGLIDVHTQKGTLPLTEVLEPAIELSKKGIRLSSYQAYINKLIKPILLLTHDGKNLFNKNNNFLKEGDLFKNPNFTNFLIGLSQKGKDFFYKGEIAELICNQFGKEGYLNYNVETLIKAMGITSMAREEVCTNPLEEMEINKINNQLIFDKYYKYFTDDKFVVNTSKLSGFGSTTHISIIDKKENIASVTTTKGEGSGHFINKSYRLVINLQHELTCFPTRPNPKAIFLACQLPIPVIGFA